MTVKNDDTIVVWFSCGAASAVAAKKTLEKYGDRCNVRVVNNPIKEEDEDNRRFLHDVEQWLGVKIESATNRKYPSCSCTEVWDERKFMSGPNGAPCTYELKKQARQQWEDANQYSELVLGFTAEEKRRYDRFALTERPNTLPVLIEDGIKKSECFHIINKAGIELPAMYRLGYPNANCIGCVKATSPTYWNHVRKIHPHQFEQRAEQSRRLGARLVRYKGKRIFLDELPTNATGKPMDTMNLECGLFCEENPQVIESLK